MPSTFTGSGIELIADGEQSGVWGQTTNDNLQIINRLVSEAGSIALSGTTHTLTISDGSLSDGQYGVLVFGGSPSGTNTVTVSPNDAKRIFIVKNATAQSVVMTQGSGGNVTIPASAFKIVYTDGGGAGAEVVDVTSVAAFTTVNATTLDTTNIEVTNIKAKDGTAAGSIADATGVVTLASSVLTTTDINGGTADNVVIGGATPAAGTFTTLTANGNVVLGDAATDTVTITADVASNIIPSADNTYDLGASGSEWKDLYIDGTANIDSLVADTADINGGTIDGTVIGGSTPAAISGTTGSFSGDLTVDTDTLIVNAATNRVGIGVTPAQRFHIKASGTTFVASAMENTNGGTDEKIVDWLNNSTVYSLRLLNDAYSEGRTAYDVTRSGNTPTIHRWYTAASGAPSERMRITSTGSVGIGTSSPAKKLQVVGSAGDTALFGGVNAGSGTENIGGIQLGSITDNASRRVWGIKSESTNLGMLGFWVSSDATSEAFNGTQVVSIDRSGHLLVGTTSAIGTGNSMVQVKGVANLKSCASFAVGANSNGAIDWYNASNAYVASVVVNASSVAYNTTSDYRLKENVVPLAGAADRLAQIPVHRFNFIADPDTTVDGFLAHEVQAFVPEAVTGEKDAVDKDGKPVYQGIDQSKLTPLLTAALQEALQKIEALEARITALEA